MSTRQFQDEVVALLRDRFPDCPFDYGSDESEVVMRTVADDPTRIFLGNLHAMTRAVTEPERETEIIRFFAAIVSGFPGSDATWDDWAEAMPLLRPKLARSDRFDADRLACRPFSERLVIAYTLDFEDRDVYVFDAHLVKWNVSLDDVHDAAIANLQHMSTDVVLELTRDRNGNGFAILNKGDFYDASRILLPTIQRCLIREMGPRVLAGVPDRIVLLAWSAGMPGQDGFIDQVRRDAAEQPYALSDEIFVITDAGVRVAAPDDFASPGDIGPEET